MRQTGRKYSKLTMTDISLPEDESPRAYQYDAFLSHNRQDKPVALALGEKLKADGLAVWLDDWNIKPGQNISIEVERGLKASRIILLLMSDAALKSGWVSLERSIVLFPDPTNENCRLIPVLLEDCEVPDELKVFKYIDWRKRSPDTYTQIRDVCTPRVNQDGLESGAIERSPDSDVAPQLSAAGGKPKTRPAATANTDVGGLDRSSSHGLIWPLGCLALVVVAAAILMVFHPFEIGGESDSIQPEETKDEPEKIGAKLASNPKTREQKWSFSWEDIDRMVRLREKGFNPTEQRTPGAEGFVENRRYD